MRLSNCVPILCVLLLCGGCTYKIDTDYVDSHAWQWEGGYKITEDDYLYFGDTDTTAEQFIIRHDTIYNLTRPVAIVVDIDKIHYEMKIRSMDSTKTGTYITAWWKNEY